SQSAPLPDRTSRQLIRVYDPPAGGSGFHYGIQVVSYRGNTLEVTFIVAAECEAGVSGSLSYTVVDESSLYVEGTDGQPRYTSSRGGLGSATASPVECGAYAGGTWDFDIAGEGQSNLTLYSTQPSFHVQLPNRFVP